MEYYSFDLVLTIKNVKNILSSWTLQKQAKVEFDHWAVVCQDMLQLNISEAFFDRV